MERGGRSLSFAGDAHTEVGMESTLEEYRTAKVALIAQESEKSFQAEQARSDKLTEKAEKYIAAIALVVGFNLIQLDGAGDAGLVGKSAFALSCIALVTLAAAL